MPIYEYECQSCKKAFELLVSSTARQVRCPHCDSPRIKKQFSVFAARQGAETQSPCEKIGCPGTRGKSSPCASGRCPLSH